ncbi:hypothetical protein E8E12_001171 [Didymella heteroderae]|uniref:Alcohol acetyltransferase FCK4 n=1 Tax=Didymella heteroderae TaxID=1769908 RepID=A0A9P5BXC8_9PLEO|nr:hypothetical protein E8E12_001171 [Didymella heteroderae]
MDASQFHKLRPCGRLETYSTARHHLGFYNNVSLTATYVTSSDSAIPIQDLLFAALQHVVAGQPNLSAIPVNEDKSFPEVYLARLPDVDLRRCVEFHTRSYPIPRDDDVDTELDKVLRQQHCLNFKSHIPGPYWRLIITSFPGVSQVLTASWIFHHALADGASAIIFHETLLEGLNKFGRAPMEKAERIVRAPTIPLAPPLEDLHPMTITWPFFLRAVAGSLVPGYFKRAPWTGAPIAQSPSRSMTKHVILSAENTRKFVARCCEQETSVSAALSVLLAFAIFEVVDPLADEINIGMPISLRPVLDLAERQMVNAITNHTTTFRRSDLSDEDGDQDIWGIARRVKGELTHEISKKGVDSPVALLKYVSNMGNFFNEKVGTQRETTAEVSNLGVYRPQMTDPAETIGAPTRSLQVEDKREMWKIGRMVFSQSANHVGPLISLNAVTGGDGCLVMSFSWPQDSPERPEGDERTLNPVPVLVEQHILHFLRGRVNEAD